MKIISFEGLGGSVGRWVRRGLLNNLRDIPGTMFYEYSWTHKPGPIPDDCIVIGHSFGVRSAVDQAKIASKCRLLLLLDPRMPPWGSGGVVWRGTVPIECFYQTGFMRGYQVGGAINHQLTNVRHTSVPAHPDVVKFMREWLTERL